MSPPLNHKNVSDYLPFLQNVTHRLVQKWNDQSVGGATVVINQDLLSYTIDVIGLIAFDVDFDCLRKPFSQEAADLSHMFETITKRALSPIWYWRIPFVGPYLDCGGFSSGRMTKFLDRTIRSFGKSSASDSDDK